MLLFAITKDDGSGAARPLLVSLSINFQMSPTPILKVPWTTGPSLVALTVGVGDKADEPPQLYVEKIDSYN
jgi:hypothetical protein